MGEQAQEASDLALSEPVSTEVQQACRPDTPDGARLRVNQAEEALKQAADAHRKRARIRIALVVMSVLAVVAGLGWSAEQKRRIDEQYVEQKAAAEQYRIDAERYRKTAEQQKEQTDIVLDRATKIVAQDDKDPAKVREFMEWAAGKGNLEAKKFTKKFTETRSLDQGQAQEPPKVDKGDDKLSPPYGSAQDNARAPESSGKAPVKGNKNARFKPLSTASRAAFWRWWGGHLAIEAKVSPAAHRATASVRW